MGSDPAGNLEVFRCSLGFLQLMAQKHISLREKVTHSRGDYS